MDGIFIAEQLLNGVGYGLMLFLIAAGLTVVFGIMDTMNLAHGSLFMVGAYLAAKIQVSSGSMMWALVGSIGITMLVAWALEKLVMRYLYRRDHLAQVLATFGIILIADDAVKAIWGVAPVMAPMPPALSTSVELLPGLPYPAYRLLLIGAGLAVAIALYFLVNHTRIGMLVRAGASNRQMAEFMGVRVGRVFSFVFVLGAGLAALAGALMGPISAVQIGMGEKILIPALVIIVIGGIGSVRGAFVAAMLVGMLDTIGRALLLPVLRAVLPPAIAADIAPALAGITVYLLMAIVLALRPQGLFPARS